MFRLFFHFELAQVKRSCIKQEAENVNPCYIQLRMFCLYFVGVKTNLCIALPEPQPIPPGYCPTG